MNEFIKKWRKEAGMTQKDLADALFLAPSAISQYESGKREVSFETLKKIAQYFQKDLSLQLIEEKVIQKITPKWFENTLKPTLVEIPGLINLNEEDVDHLLTLGGEHYFLESHNQDAFSVTLDLFVDFVKEKNLQEGKGFIACIRGGGNLTFEHLDFFSEHLHKRINHNANVLVAAHIDEEATEFQLTLCGFGF